MNILHLLATGGAAGIETLVKDFADLSKHNNIYVFFWAGGVVTEEMKKKGHNVIELNSGKKEIFGPLKRLERIVENEKVDVIITHHASPVMWIIMNLLKKKYKKIKTIVYAHANLKDIYRENIKRGLFIRKKILNWTYNNANQVIAISESVKRSFLDQNYSDTEKIKVVYNGVNLEKFVPKSFDAHNPVRIAYVGRLVPQKGVNLLIDALAELNSEIEFVCDIVGDGSERENLEKLSLELSMESKITFHGVRRDIADFLVEEDIFVHPAIWEEGFGIALAEGMAAGLLCMGFKKGAIPEIIDNEENGLLVNTSTADALAKQLAYAIELVKTEKGREMRRKAIEKAKKFSIYNFVNSVDELCSEL